jgi:hypothetical protein
MSVKEDFNDNSYQARKINGYVLGVSYDYGGGGTTYMTYDFLARVMIARTGSSDGGTTVTPFSRLDREALESLRESLIALGGNPPELQQDASAPCPAGTQAEPLTSGPTAESRRPPDIYTLCK